MYERLYDQVNTCGFSCSHNYSHNDWFLCSKLQCLLKCTVITAPLKKMKKILLREEGKNNRWSHAFYLSLWTKVSNWFVFIRTKQPILWELCAGNEELRFLFPFYIPCTYGGQLVTSIRAKLGKHFYEDPPPMEALSLRYFCFELPKEIASSISPSL